jgi:hypothetical protein
LEFERAHLDFGQTLLLLACCSVHLNDRNTRLENILSTAAHRLLFPPDEEEDSMRGHGSNSTGVEGQADVEALIERKILNAYPPDSELRNWLMVAWMQLHLSTDRCDIILEMQRQIEDLFGQLGNPLPMAVVRLFKAAHNHDTEYRAVIAEPKTSIYQLVDELPSKGGQAKAPVEPTHAPPLASPLQRLLQSTKRAARASNQAVVTPHLLLALLRTPVSPTKAAFDEVKPGLANGLERRLSEYLAGAPLGPFVDFDWLERADIRAAQAAAAQQGCAVVTDGHLLAGILSSKSNTQQQLAGWLGAELLNKIKQTALRVALEPQPYNTPDIYLPPN